MFYCDDCAGKRKWPVFPRGMQSYGKCEICGETAGCNDVQSGRLPIPKEADDDADS